MPAPYRGFARNGRLLAMLLLASTARADDAREEYATFVGGVLRNMEKTNEASQLSASSRAAGLSHEAALLESPWAVSASLSREDERPLSPEPESPDRKSYQAVTEAKYVARSGIEASIGTSSSLVDSTRRAEIFPDEHRTAKQTQLTARLAYDVVKGGQTGEGVTRARLDEATTEQRRHDLRSQRRALQKRYHDLAADLYVATCKSRQIADSTKLVAETVRQGDIKRQAQTLSTKDYLNFLSLKDSLERRTATGELNRVQLRARVLGAGLVPAEDLAKLERAVTRCTVGWQLAKDRGSSLTTDASALATTHPAFLAAESARAATEFRLRLSRLAEKPSVSPFVAGSWVPPPEKVRSESGSVTVGMELTWNLPQQAGALSTSAAAAELKAAAARTEAARADAELEITSIVLRIKSQITVLSVLERNLANAEILLTTLESQLAVGSVDSLSYSNAYLNKVDVFDAIMDAWIELEKLLVELDLYGPR